MVGFDPALWDFFVLVEKTISLNTFTPKSDLNGHCPAIWQLYKRLENAFASIEFQN